MTRMNPSETKIGDNYSLSTYIAYMRLNFIKLKEFTSKLVVIKVYASVDISSLIMVTFT